MNIHTLRSQRPYVLSVSDKANLLFSLPLTLVIAAHVDRVPLNAAMRLGLYVTQSRWLSGVPLEGDSLESVLRASEMLVLGPELAVRVWPEKREGALISRDDFSRDRLEANEICRVQLPHKGLVVAALGLSQRNLRSIFAGFTGLTMWQRDGSSPT